MPLKHILDNCPGLINADVAIFQHWHSPQGVARPMFVRLQVFRVERHLVDVVRQLKFFKQPDDSART